MSVHDWAPILAGWTANTHGHITRWTAPGHLTATAMTERNTLTMFGLPFAGMKARGWYDIGEVPALLAVPLDPVEAIADKIGHELETLRARQEARRILAAESAEQIEMPPVMRLGAFLDVVDTDPEYRVDRLLPTGGNVLFPAPAKAGKSTTIGNLARSFADGDPFLGTFTTQPARVVIIDNEMDDRGLRRWLRDQNIQNVDQVDVVSLRGRTRSFNILDTATRARWAEALTGADVLIFDCLRPVLDALGLDENRDAGQFLVALDALKVEAGIDEAILVHHMGHSGDRARGDSRLLGWPDVTWKITLDKDSDPATSPRFFSAFGRDVNVPEMQLEYDAGTRRMTVSGLSRRDAAIEVALVALVELLGQHKEGMSQAAFETALMAQDIPRTDIRQAAHVAQQRALTIVVQGLKNAKVHHLRRQLASSPQLAASSPATTPVSSPPPIRGELANTTETTEHNDLATANTTTGPHA